MNNNFENVCVGDKVLRHTSVKSTPQIEEVIRVSAKTFATNTNTVFKSNGVVRGAGPWSKSFYVSSSKEEIEVLEARAHRHAEFPDLKTGILSKVEAIKTISQKNTAALKILLDQISSMDWDSIEG